MPSNNTTRGACAKGIGQGLWSDPANEDLLRRLWEEGLSARQIAERIPGTTRNGILGKVFRLGLPKRNTTSNQCYTNAHSGTKKLPWSRKARPTEMPPEGDEPVEIVAMATDPTPDECLSIGDIQFRGQCHWPLHTNDKGEHLFCGRPTFERGSGAWCAEHAARAYINRNISIAKMQDWTPARKIEHSTRMRILWNKRKVENKRRAGVA